MRCFLPFHCLSWSVNSGLAAALSTPAGGRSSTSFVVVSKGFLNLPRSSLPTPQSYRTAVSSVFLCSTSPWAGPWRLVLQLWRHGRNISSVDLHMELFSCYFIVVIVGHVISAGGLPRGRGFVWTLCWSRRGPAGLVLSRCSQTVQLLCLVGTALPGVLEFVVSVILICKCHLFFVIITLSLPLKNKDLVHTDDANNDLFCSLPAFSFWDWTMIFWCLCSCNLWRIFDPPKNSSCSFPAPCCYPWTLLQQLCMVHSW